MKQKYMVFDAESIGIQGEAFAIGYVVVDSGGTELQAVMYACPPSRAIGNAKGRQWVADNVPRFDDTHGITAGIRGSFWQDWMYWKAQGALLVGDCAWPVEARLLLDCVADDSINREWQGPYPLHDLATARLMAGYDPLATVDRLSNELPIHNPLADARQSARLWLDALHTLGLDNT